jgi:hypothetical protein
VAHIYTSQAGNWNDPATWSGGVVPLVNVDQVTTDHAVTVTADAGIGVDDTANRQLRNNAPFTVSAGVTFTIRGRVYGGDFFYVEAGASLVFDTSTDANWEHSNSGHAALIVQGTAENPCTIEAIGAGAVTFDSGSQVWQGAGVGRMEVTHATFRRCGSASNPMWLGYDHLDTDPAYPFFFRDVTIDQCYAIECIDGGSNNQNPGHTGHLEFTRVKLVSPQTPDPLPFSNWAHLAVLGFKDMTIKVDCCDFPSDSRVYLQKPNDVAVTGCVFRGGILRRWVGDN